MDTSLPRTTSDHVKEERLQILEAAKACAANWGFVAKKERNSGPLIAFYKNLVQHADWWYTTIFHPPGDPMYCFAAIGVLRVLPEHVYRPRGKILQCCNVIEHTMKVLECLRVQSHEIDVPKYGELQKRICWNSAYQVHRIRFKPYAQLGKKDEAVFSCRWLLGYEMKEKIPLQERSLPLTDDQFWNVSDETLWAIINRLLDFECQCNRSVGGGPVKDCRVRSCNACGKMEQKVGKLQSCSRCKKAFYCSRGCQMKDWSEHKKVCRKADAADDGVREVELPNGRAFIYNLNP